MNDAFFTGPKHQPIGGDFVPRSRTQFSPAVNGRNAEPISCSDKCYPHGFSLAQRNRIFNATRHEPRTSPKYPTLFESTIIISFHFIFCPGEKYETAAIIT